jgi:hypothetical protein
LQPRHKIAPDEVLANGKISIDGAQQDIIGSLPAQNIFENCEHHETRGKETKQSRAGQSETKRMSFSLENEITKEWKQIPEFVREPAQKILIDHLLLV